MKKIYTDEEARLRNLEAGKRWKEKNKDKTRQHAKDSYARRSEKVKSYVKEWRSENIDWIRERDREAGVEYFKAHKEELWEKHVKRKHKDWRQYMLNKTKARAKKKGIPFNIELDDIVIPEKCPVLGVPFTFEPDPTRKNKFDFLPSIDRLKPELGYVKGNINVMSARANRFKNDSTPEELKLVSEWLEKNYDKN